MTSELEAELVEAASFEPTKNYERQDYLAALARAINEVEEDVFDGLSVEAQDWFNAAVKAINKKQEIADFPDIEEAEEGGEVEAEAETTDEAEDEEGEGDSSDEAEAEAEAEDEPEEKPAKPKKVKKVSLKHMVNVVPGKKPSKPLPPPGDNKDRYGVTIGSQGYKAIKMLEQGNRMSVVQEEVGGTYYNLLKKLVKDGHKIEKSPTGIIKLTHKDDIKKAKGKK